MKKLLKKKLGLGETLVKSYSSIGNGTGQILAILELKDHFSDQRIYNSLNILVQKYCFLRSKIEENYKNSSFLFLDNLENLPLYFKKYSFDFFLKKEVNNIISDKSFPLWRFTYLTTLEEEKYFIFSAHHSLCDGKSAINLLIDLLYSCSSEPEISFEKSEYNLPKSILNPSIRKTDWWIYSFKNLFSSLRLKLATKWFHDEKSFCSLRTPNFEFFTIRPPLMKRIKEECENRNITVNSFLYSIMHSCFAKQRKVSSGFYMIFTPVCIRRFLEDRAKKEFGYFVSWLNLLFFFKNSDNLREVWKFAYRYNKRIKKGVKKKNFPFLKTIDERLIDMETIREKNRSEKGGYSDYGILMSNLGEMSYSSVTPNLAMKSAFFGTVQNLSSALLFSHVVTINSKCFICFSYSEPVLKKQSVKKFLSLFEATLEKLLGDI